MNPLLSGYAVALGVVFLLWLGVSLFVLVTRVIYDVQLGFVRTARRLVEGRVESALADSADVERTLSRLPRRTIERVGADTATPPALAAAFAGHAAARSQPRLLAAAATHKNEVGKWRRIAALRILARDGSYAVLPLLERALGDADEDIVNAAATTLGEIPDERAAALLIAALRQGGASRSRIATQLDEFPLDIGHLLLPLLRDWDSSVRYWSVKLLARYRTLRSLPVELAALGGDDDPAVRAAVAETLGSVGGPAATSTAMALLDDPVPFVRAHAARALGAQGSPELAALVARLLADEEWWVRAGAKRALAQLGPEATEHVMPYLESPDAFARNGAAEVLQNTGVVDQLVRELIAGASSELPRRVLHQVIEAGGDRFGEAMIARAGGGEDRLRALLGHNEPEP